MSLLLRGTGRASGPLSGLTFVPNRGQVDARALYYARVGSGTVWLTRRGPVLDVRRPVGERTPTGGPARQSPWTTYERLAIRQTFVDASPDVRLEGREPAAATASYLVGDSSAWRTGVETYRLVTYREAWRGIDVRLYGLGADLEQEYVVRPGARPDSIRLRLEGVTRLAVAADGALELGTDLGTLRQAPPSAYQHVDGRRVAVPVRYRLLGGGKVGFAVGPWRRDRPLVIDPVLLYSTYLGGVHDDAVEDIVAGPDGEHWVVGESASEDFPVTAGALQRTRGAIGVYHYNAFVAQVGPTGAPRWITFLGGNAGACLMDQALGVARGPQGQIYVVGKACSPDFPVTTSAAQPTLGGGSDAFLAVLASDGSRLLYSTFVGGPANETGFEVAVDAAGRAHLCGHAEGAGLPTTPGVVQPDFRGGDNGFVAQIDPSASGTASLGWLTYLGGHGAFGGLFTIALDADGNVYVGGQTQASDWPATPGAFIQSFMLNGACSPNDPPRTAGVVAKLAPDGRSLLFGTYLGGTQINQQGLRGCDQYVHDIAVDAERNVHVLGSTSTGNFPTTPGAAQTTFGCCTFQSFVADLAASGSSLLYSTYLSGLDGQTFSGKLAVAPDGELTVVGSTQGTMLPTSGDALQPTPGGGFDAYVVRVSADGTTFPYASYLGGNGDDIGLALARDDLDNLYLGGKTNSTSGFPVTPGAIQPEFRGGDSNDAWLAALGSGALGVVRPARVGTAGSATLTITGSGFLPGATARLRLGPTTIDATRVSVAADGASVTALFDLTGAAPGAWDVEVLNPDGRNVTRAGALTVEAGGAPAPWVGVAGRSAVRTNTPTHFYLTYGNSGDQDAYGLFITLSYPKGLTVTPEFQTLTPPQPAAGPPIAYEDVGPAVEIEGRMVMSLFVPALPAGSSEALPLLVTQPVDGPFSLDVSITPPIATSLAGIEAAFAAATPPGALGFAVLNAAVNAGAAVSCLQDITGLGFTLLNAVIPANCLVAGLRTFPLIIGAGVSVFGAPASRAVYNTGQMWVSVLNAAGNCAGIVIPPPIRFAIAGIQAGLQAAKTIDDCSKAFPPADQGSASSNGQGSIDPNDKSGPTGFGARRWIGTAAPFDYAVEFENLPTATAPAAEVTISDHLDPALVDPATVTFGPVGWGSHLLTPPPGANAFSQTVDLRPDQELLVRVAGSVDVTTGLVRWAFTSIDPATGLPPADPSVGFLPADTSPPAGQGTVLFTVAPRALAAGTAISNQARVVFDRNAPIDTPTWTNTVAPCDTEAACRGVLGSSLPSPTGLKGKARKVAKKLAALRGRSERTFGQLESIVRRGRTSKKVLRKEARLRAGAVKALGKLVTIARDADGAGTLGVPLLPLEGAAEVLQGLLAT